MIVLLVIAGVLLCEIACTPRIIGGNETTIQSHPYLLSLRLKRVHICGAGLVSRDRALTAAHCFATAQGSYSVRAGSSFVDRGGVVAYVKRAVLHPGFSWQTNDCDVAIAILAGPFDFSEAIRPAKIPAVNAARPGTGAVGTVAGWGFYNNYQKKTSRKLRAVDLPIYDKHLCGMSYPYGLLTDRMFCAGLSQGGKDSCQGDSGGPFVINGVIYGIVSSGFDCGQPNYPGVYADVLSMIRFIKAYTKS